MFPWLFNWAPVLHFPWSGEVVQDIRPQTDWFFGQIAAGTGDGQIEKRIFEEVASYGKQLGVITDVLLEQTRGTESESVAQLRQIVEKVNHIKSTEREHRRQRVRDALLSLKEADGAGVKELVKEMQAQL